MPLRLLAKSLMLMPSNLAVELNLDACLRLKGFNQIPPNILFFQILHVFHDTKSITKEHALKQSLNKSSLGMQKGGWEET